MSRLATHSARGVALERGGLITQSPSIGAPQDPGTRPAEGGPSVYPASTSEIASLTGAPASFYAWRTSREPVAAVYKTEVEQIL